MAAATAVAPACDNLQGLDDKFDKALVPPSNNSHDTDHDEDRSVRKPAAADSAHNESVCNGTASNESASNEENAEEAATAILDDLLRFRDRYFESHSWQDAHRKKDDVAVEIKTALTKLEKLNEPLTAAGRQAYYLTLRGRINNANQVRRRKRDTGSGNKG